MISGKTRLAGLIGSDTKNSLSPQIHNFLAKTLGQDIVYTTFNVQPMQLEIALKGAYALGIAGLNITAPHKKTVLMHISKLDESAEKLEVTNLLKHTDEGYVAYNTDVYGISQSLQHYGITSVKSATIYGAGGAAKAAVAALVEKGCKKLNIMNRSEAYARVLAQFARASYGINAKFANALTEGDIFIQASSAKPNELMDVMPKNYNLVFDMNYPKANPWLAQFPNTFDGKCMLIFQALQAYEIMWDATVDNKTKSKLLNKFLI